MSEEDYSYLEKKTLALFESGTEYAKNKGLILVILNMSLVNRKMVRYY